MWLDTENEQDPYNRLGGPSQAPNTSIGAGGGTSSPGGGTTAGTAASGTSSNPSTQTPVQSTGPAQNFATVQDYLGANKAQGEDLGQKFTGALDTTAANEKNTIDSAAAQTKTDAANSTVSYDPNLTQTALSHPTDVTNSPDQLNSFLKQWNAEYSGPASFEASSNYGKAADAATEAGQKQAELGSVGGQQQLIQDQFGVYGQGNKGLDQAVLQNSSFYPKVQNQAGTFQNVQDYLGQQATDVNAATNAAKTSTDAAKKQTQDAFTNNLTNFKSGLDTRVAAAQNNATAAAAKYQADLASGDPALVTQDLQEAGATPDQIKNVTDYLKDLDKDYSIKSNLTNQYAFNPNVDINTANVANAQDYANAAAYGKLTGQDYSGVLNPNDITQAGTAPIASTGLNTGRVADYLKTQLGQQDQARLGTPGNLSDIISGKTNPTDAAQYAQRYVDAATRQGTTYANSPGIQKMLADAITTRSSILQQGAVGSDPRLAGIQAVIDKFSQFANIKPPQQPNTPSTPPPVIPASRPITVTAPDPNQHGGVINTPIDPNVLVNPKSIDGFDQKFTTGLQSQIAKLGGGNPSIIARNTITQQGTQLKALYTQYLNGKINAKDYVQLQHLLQQFNIK